MATTYKGFSTHNRYKKFRVTDLDLVKQNIFNHFNIRKGEKLMQPNFGSLIWNMLFEPLTEETRQMIVNDVKTVVSYDPRVRVQNVAVTQFDYGIQLLVELSYLTSNQVDTLVLDFDNRSRSLSRSE
jgi:phage baseplate assembly protein W